MSERSSRIPFFDDVGVSSFRQYPIALELTLMQDPCYPKIVLGYDVADPVMYPDLGYRGPIAP